MPHHGASATPAVSNALANLEASLNVLKRALGDAEPADAPEANPVPDTPVFAALRKWRTDQARAKAVPPYIIATDALLRAIEEAKPADLEQLQAVRGFSPTKAATYGSDILQVVKAAA